MDEIEFLPGVPVKHVLERLNAAGGSEVESGKFTNKNSSAALAINAFGFFCERPEALPPIPGLKLDVPATHVEVEYCARFPWSGGRHPWLDAMVETPLMIVGVESKRYEPFRDSKSASFSEAYDREVWGIGMGSFKGVRDALRTNPTAYKHLDAAQLVKHAFGLVTDARKSGKQPVLLYVYAEPAVLDGKPIATSAFIAHRDEVGRFARSVAGSEVRFHAIGYREWFDTWPEAGGVAAHARALIERFAL